MADQLPEEEVSAEIARLQAKQAAIDDEDIRLALQGRIDSLAAELAQRKLQSSDNAKAAEEPLQQASPEEIVKADGLIRQARVETMRGNGARAQGLIKEAEALAPNAPSVLEAVGDAYVERKQYKAAAAAFKRAIDLVPGNVGLEKKHAHVVFRTAGLGTLDDQMRANLSDTHFISSEDAVASLTAARFMNAFLPGVGNMVLGRAAAGVTLLICYVVAILWLCLERKDLVLLTGMLAGKPTRPNFLVCVPIFMAVVIFFIGQASLGVAKPTPRKPANRPVPPVNLPFE